MLKKLNGFVIIFELMIRTVEKRLETILLMRNLPVCRLVCVCGFIIASSCRRARIFTNDMFAVRYTRNVYLRGVLFRVRTKRTQTYNSMRYAADFRFNALLYYMSASVFGTITSGTFRCVLLGAYCILKASQDNIRVEGTNSILYLGNVTFNVNFRRFVIYIYRLNV